MPALRPLSKTLVSFLFLLSPLSGLGTEQAAEVNISVQIETPIVRLRGRFATQSTRVLTFHAETGRVRNTQFADGVWSYEVDLTPPKDASPRGRSSWIRDGLGLFILDELLPQPTRGQAGAITLDVPQGWQVFSTGHRASGIYATDLEKAIVIVGTGIREHQLRAGSLTAELLLSGKWAFTDQEAKAASGQVFRSYTKLFGSSPADRFLIAIAPFPTEAAVDKWQADTRGQTAVILSSDTAFKSQSIQRLHEQLRHEIFHFWFPNGVNLTGNYDWFYEGFALYQSLKLGVAVNRIRFDDYLDTLTRAYQIDRRAMQGHSLIDLSANRWANDNNTQVYARGMLTAFFCDLKMLAASNGRRSSNDLVREIYVRHRSPAAPEDGNAAVLAAMRQQNLGSIINRMVTGSERVELDEYIRPAGLEYASAGLNVTSRPSSAQKQLLDKLGYNNWRKLSK